MLTWSHSHSTPSSIPAPFRALLELHTQFTSHNMSFQWRKTEPFPHTISVLQFTTHNSSPTGLSTYTMCQGLSRMSVNSSSSAHSSSVMAPGISIYKVATTPNIKWHIAAVAAVENIAKHRRTLLAKKTTGIFDDAISACWRSVCSSSFATHILSRSVLSRTNIMACEAVINCTLHVCIHTLPQVPAHQRSSAPREFGISPAKGRISIMQNNSWQIQWRGKTISGES